MSLYKKEFKAIQELIELYKLPQVTFELWVWIDTQDFRKWTVMGGEVKEVS